MCPWSRAVWTDMDRYDRVISSNSSTRKPISFSPNSINLNGINVDYARWLHNLEGFPWYLIFDLVHISAQQLSNARLTDPQSKYYFVCDQLSDNISRKYSVEKNLRSTEIKRFKRTWKHWCGLKSLSHMNSISKLAILVCCSWEFSSAVTRTRSLSLAFASTASCVQQGARPIWEKKTGQQHLLCKHSWRTSGAGWSELNAVVWFSHHSNHINPAPLRLLSFYPSPTDTQTRHPILLHRGSRLTRFPKAFQHSWLFLSQPEPPENNNCGARAGKHKDWQAKGNDRMV